MTSDQTLGCLLGGAMGDALGAPFEGRPPGRPPASTLELGQPTDDTQLTAATCEAIAGCRGGVEPSRIAAAMLAWWKRGEVHGLGGATLGALRALDAGGHWALVGRRGEHAAGNGAAMRIAPLALTLDSRDPIARRTARDVCRITHHSDEAWIAALALWRAIEEAIAGRLTAPGYIERVTSDLPDSLTRDALLELAAAPASSSEEVAARVGTGGHAPESVTLAIAVAPAVTRDFEGEMGALVHLGGDADTIASMCGHIAGAALGASCLPDRWRGALAPWVEPVFIEFTRALEAI